MAFLPSANASCWLNQLSMGTIQYGGGKEGNTYAGYVTSPYDSYFREMNFNYAFGDHVANQLCFWRILRRQPHDFTV